MENVQKRAGIIFGENNERMGLAKVFMHLNFRVTSLQRTIRKRDIDIASRQCAQVFAWIAGVANLAELGINLYQSLLDRYPGVCPYCGDSPHTCGTKRPDSRLPTDILAHFRNSLPDDIDAQLMLYNIYPENVLAECVEHLIEESGELGQAISQESPAEIEIELVDMLAHLCGIASILGFNLLDQVLVEYQEGCTGCGKAPCKCIQFHQCKVGSISLGESDACS